MSELSVGRQLLNKLFYDKGEFSVKKAAMGVGLNGYFAVSEYEDQRAEGNGMIRSGIAAAGDLALGYLNMPLMIAKDLVPAAAGAAVDGYYKLSQYSRGLQRQNRNTPFQNATFVDSQQTYTMRQAGMNLARQGQYAAQQTTMGNEAASINYNGL